MLTGSVRRLPVQVKSALSQWLSRERLSGLPLLALGGSSGGAFVLHLAAHMAGAFRGVAAQIMAVMANTYREYDRHERRAGAGAPGMQADGCRRAAVSRPSKAPAQDAWQAGMGAPARCISSKVLCPVHVISTTLVSRSQYHLRHKACFASLHIRLCPAPCAAPRSKRKAGEVSAPYPPVLFIHMPRDTHIAYLVANNMEELRAIVRPPGTGAGACP